MAFLVSSAACGYGSVVLSGFSQHMLGNALNLNPMSANSVFLYGLASSGVSRVVEYSARELCTQKQLSDGQAIALTVGVIATQVFSAYLVAAQLKRTLNLEVCKNFIHLENTLFLASVLEFDFELTANRIKANTFPQAVDDRLYLRFKNLVTMGWNEIMRDIGM